MGFFSSMFTQPQQVAPRVTERPPMTSYAGRVINADKLTWCVHQYLIDTAVSAIVYDKYYRCDSEYQARSLAQSLQNQRLAGSCVNRTDWWGEYAEESYQQALDKIKSRLADDYKQSLSLAVSKSSDSKSKALDSINKRYLSLKEEHRNLQREYDKLMQEHEHQTEQDDAEDVEQISEEEQRELLEQIKSALREEITAEMREQMMSEMRIALEERIRITRDSIVQVLSQPERNAHRAQRLSQDADFIKLRGSVEEKLVKYYINQLLVDEEEQG